jgi:predicted component of type VI protein secretion system
VNDRDPSVIAIVSSIAIGPFIATSSPSLFDSPSMHRYIRILALALAKFTINPFTCRNARLQWQLIRLAAAAAAARASVVGILRDGYCA